MTCSMESLNVAQAGAVLMFVMSDSMPLLLGQVRAHVELPGFQLQT